MRIERPKPSSERLRQFSDQVAKAVDARGIDGRVCGVHCAIVCPQCGSTACQCRCAPECPDAPATLSSDPQSHPIEPAADPLVYEMRRLGMFRPCWSCEGHLDPKGSLWKLPAVWFYCESLVHVRLLGAGLSRLSTNRTLKAKWQVVVTFSDPDNIETAFALEPKQPIGEGIGLTELRADLSAIARALPGLMTREARDLKASTQAMP